jgi:hypothetical protein
MYRRTLAALLMGLSLSAMALAAPKCSPFTVAGSYVRQVPPYIDQLTLGIDGTVYAFSSAAFHLILEGTSIPGIGSWTCLKDDTVLVTTIDSGYLNNFGDIPQPGLPLDIYISDNFRVTRKFSVLDGNTLQETERIVTRVSLSDDPFGPGVLGGSSCMPSGKPCAAAPYRRIKPQVADIP